MGVGDKHSIDPIAVEARYKPFLGADWRRNAAARLIDGILLFYGAFLVPGALKAGDVRTLIDPASSSVRSALPWMILVTIVAFVFAEYQIRKHRRDGPVVIAQRMEEHWEEMTNDGWVYRTLRKGVVIGLWIGIPFGMLPAFIIPVAELPAKSRFVMVGAFAAFTVLGTLLIFFLTRWDTLRRYRRMQLAIND